MTSKNIEDKWYLKHRSIMWNHSYNENPPNHRLAKIEISKNWKNLVQRKFKRKTLSIERIEWRKKNELCFISSGNTPSRLPRIRGSKLGHDQLLDTIKFESFDKSDFIGLKVYFRRGYGAINALPQLCPNTNTHCVQYISNSLIQHH